MNYTKPEVAVLGEAVSVIQQHQKIVPSTSDSLKVFNPAYDLDE